MVVSLSMSSIEPPVADHARLARVGAKLFDGQFACRCLDPLERRRSSGWGVFLGQFPMN
jgi:hypothetical protein